MPYAGSVRHQQDVVISAFRSAEACDPAHAIPLGSLPRAALTERRVRTTVLERFVELGILVPDGGDRHHLDDPLAQALLDHRSGMHLWRMADDP
ncbi:MAG: hypothetical protein U0Q07_16545 [Acidimicrobiales bacterium]